MLNLQAVKLPNQIKAALFKGGYIIRAVKELEFAAPYAAECFMPPLSWAECYKLQIAFIGSSSSNIETSI